VCIQSDMNRKNREGWENAAYERLNNRIWAGRRIDAQRRHLYLSEVEAVGAAINALLIRKVVK